jgi:transposase
VSREHVADAGDAAVFAADHGEPKEKRAVYSARRRTKSERGKQLSWLRSELTERSFAHVCDTGGARRTWLRGLTSVAKRHLMMVAARNLSTIMRAIIGIGGPRSLRGLRALLQTAWTHFDRLVSALEHLMAALAGYGPTRSTAIGG